MSKRNLGGLFISFSLLLASALAVHAAPSKEAPPGDPAKGKVIFNHFCAPCHGLNGKGNGINAVNLDPAPADLTSSQAAKLSDDEIMETIQKGGGEVGLSIQMPPWGRSIAESQIRHIIAYIRTLQVAAGTRKAEAKSDEAGSQGPKAVRFASMETGGKADCPICHKKVADHRQLAPNIGHEGSKLHRDWLFAFLKSPHRIRPIGFIPLSKTMMPNFQFSDEEASALVEYLMSLKDAGVSKSEMGTLRMTPEQIEQGRTLFTDQFACDACHRIGDKGGVIGPNLKEASKRLRPEWIFHWLKNPQAVRPDSPMPNFGVSNAQARALIAFILSSGEGPAPATDDRPLSPQLVEKGKTIVEKKNCTFCHVLDTYNSNTRRRMVTYDVLVQTTER
jgi:mono/diheme cytochrome c family protein